MRILPCALLIRATACGGNARFAQARLADAEVKPCSAGAALLLPDRSADSIRAVFIELDDDSARWAAQQKAFVDTFQVNAMVVHSIVGYRSLHGRPTASRVGSALHLLHHPPAGTAIYIGLAYAEKFNSDQLSSADVDLAIRQDVAAANELIRRAGDDASNIAGWYLSRELHNFKRKTPAQQAEQVRRVRRYLTGVIAGLPRRDRVLISPYFVPPAGPNDTDLLGPSETAGLFAALVRGTPVTEVLLQDGTGVRNTRRDSGCRWDAAAYISVAARYAATVADSLRGTATFWSNLEGFTRQPENVAERFKLQLAAVPFSRPLIMFAAAQCDSVGVCTRKPRP